MYTSQFPVLFVQYQQQLSETSVQLPTFSLAIIIYYDNHNQIWKEAFLEDCEQPGKGIFEKSAHF